MAESVHDGLPDFPNATPNEVEQWGKQIAYEARQFREIQATLIVNCEQGRRLGRLGLQYDKDKVVLHNLVAILDSLTAVHLTFGSPAVLGLDEEAPNDPD